MVILIIILYILGVLSFIYNRNHCLSILLRMEVMILARFNLIILRSLNEFFEYVVYYLIFVVCEASLGLSILVLIRFYFGRDYINSIFITGC